MKNIFIISDAHPKKWSGVEKVSDEIGKKLAYKYNVFHLFMDSQNKKNTNNNISYISLGVPNFKWINTVVFLFKLYFFLKKQNVDLIIDSTWSSFLSSIFWKYKIVGICHGVSKAVLHHTRFKNNIEKLKYYLFFGFNSFLTKYVFKRAFSVVTLSKYLKKDLIKYYWIQEKKIKIIYNWFDYFNYNIKNNNKSALNVLFISNDHIRKGIDILENVAKHFIWKNIVFYIAGSFYNSTYNNVKYLGKLQRNNLYDLMKKSDIIFLPSYYEWQPLVILEAMNFWCIPVISRNCHMDMIEETTLQKFIIDNDYKKYIKIFEELLEYKEINELKNISKSCIKTFSWENQSQKYLEYINTIL